jgi:hypothetical protein
MILYLLNRLKSNCSSLFQGFEQFGLFLLVWQEIILCLSFILFVKVISFEISIRKLGWFTLVLDCHLLLKETSGSSGCLLGLRARYSSILLQFYLKKNDCLFFLLVFKGFGNSSYCLSV